MAIGDHLVLASLLCRFRNGRSKRFCVSSRVYLIIWGVGWGRGPQNQPGMRCTVREIRTHRHGSRLRNARAGRAGDRRGAVNPARLSGTGCRPKPPSLQMRKPAWSLCGDQSQRPRWRGAGSRVPSRAEVLSSCWEPALPSSERWRTMPERLKGTQIGPGATSPQSGGAVQSLEDIPEATEAHQTHEQGLLTGQLLCEHGKGCFSNGFRKPRGFLGSPRGPEQAAHSQRGSARAASPRLVLGLREEGGSSARRSENLGGFAEQIRSRHGSLLSVNHLGWDLIPAMT